MIKRFQKLLSAILACALLFSFAASAFSDIKDPAERLSAESLKSLGIMEGMGGDVFSPGTNLTRAQFCKIAVLAMGLEDAQSFKNYTLFPDVRHTHWSAPYVNAAVKKYAIIQGFPDGTFRPDETLTYGQAVTIMINMLGYKVEDVGPFWPGDYVQKADEIGLSKGISLKGNSLVTRGEAAILARNLLLSNTKEKGVFITGSFANTAKDAILIATSKNDSSLKSNEAKFSIEGVATVKTLTGTLSQGVVGAKGYLVYDKGGAEVKGFVPDTSAMKTATVKKSYADRIETSIGEITVPKKAKVVAAGAISDYETGWIDITADSIINIYYDKSGAVELVSAESAGAGENTFVFGLSDALYIPPGAKVIKNGYPATTADIKKFDVVSVDYDMNTVAVSDKKLKGNYESGSPSYTFPSKVKVLNREFTISDSAAKYFKNAEIGKEIILLLDGAGNVAAAAPGSMLSFEQLGILESLSETSAVVTLLNGITIECPANLTGGGYFESSSGPVSNYYRREGQLVSVNQGSNGRLVFGSTTYKKPASAWNLENKKIGEQGVLEKVKIYEQASDEAPLRAIELEDIPSGLVGSDKIRHVVPDYAGRAQAIIVGDVTGDAYDYGIVKGGSETIVTEITDEKGDVIGTETKNLWAAHLMMEDGTKSYYPATPPTVYNMLPSGVPKGMEKLKYVTKLPIISLKSVGTVGRDAFDGAKGVTTKEKGYVKLSDEVQVYAPKVEKFISLSEARTNYESFELFFEKEPHEGGKIRVILAR